MAHQDATFIEEHCETIIELIRPSSTYFEMTFATNWLRTCACSLGGPGRKRDEQSGGRSTLGTKLKCHQH